MEVRLPIAEGWTIGTRTVNVAASSADRRLLLKSALSLVSPVSDNSVAASESVLMIRTFKGNKSFYFVAINGETATVTSIYGSLVPGRIVTNVVWDFKGARAGDKKYRSIINPRLDPAPARREKRGVYERATEVESKKIFAHIGTQGGVGKEGDVVDVAEEEEEEELRADERKIQLQEEEGERLAAEMEDDGDDEEETLQKPVKTKLKTKAAVVKKVHEDMEEDDEEDDMFDDALTPAKKVHVEDDQGEGEGEDDMFAAEAEVSTTPLDSPPPKSAAKAALLEESNDDAMADEAEKEEEKVSAPPSGNDCGDNIVLGTTVVLRKTTG